jgi:cytochrome c oxidase subunit 2
VLVATAVVLAALVLAGCESPSILRSDGSAAEQIRQLAIWVFAILAIVLISVWSILIYVVITGRHRPEDKASQTKGNLRIEIVWTAIPAVIVTVLFVLTVVYTERINLPDPGAQFTAVGNQWWWDFDFPELGFKSPNEVYVAQGRQTEIKLLSADVIHSFWVPQMGGKVDMIPGHVNHIRFVPLKEGAYLGECAEFCGVQHGRMRFQFVVVSPKQYSAWVANQQKPAREPTGAEAIAGKQVIASVGCGSCHAIRGTSLKGTFGPDLTHFGSRMTLAALTRPNDRGDLDEWLRDPQHVKPGNRMPKVALSNADRGALVRYLEGLK